MVRSAAEPGSNSSASSSSRRDTRSRYAGDFAAQLKQTYATMDRVLDHYGATRNQVVSQTLYVVNLRQNAAATAEGNLGYFGDHRPATASTVLGMQGHISASRSTPSWHRGGNG
ncbi:RidA family protein [Streptomyces sp. NPDC057743]|uniref:RidA family protein n=1 Tax=Streptomyces sp. NPDC057743 TaxID=3346236 RepID=UPI0036BDE8B1